MPSWWTWRLGVVFIFAICLVALGVNFSSFEAVSSPNIVEIASIPSPSASPSCAPSVSPSPSTTVFVAPRERLEWPEDFETGYKNVSFSYLTEPWSYWTVSGAKIASCGAVLELNTLYGRTGNQFMALGNVLLFARKTGACVELGRDVISAFPFSHMPVAFRSAWVPVTVELPQSFVNWTQCPSTSQNILIHSTVPWSKSVANVYKSNRVGRILGTKLAARSNTKSLGGVPLKSQVPKYASSFYGCHGRLWGECGDDSVNFGAKTMPYNSPLYPELIGELRTTLGAHWKTVFPSLKTPLPASVLVFHIRAGDVYSSPKDAPSYAQPPVAFVEWALKHHVDKFGSDKASVIMVADPKDIDKSPIPNALRQLCDEYGVPFQESQGTTVEDDLVTIARARSFVADRSTFWYGALSLSTWLQTLYIFDIDEAPQLHPFSLTLKDATVAAQWRQPTVHLIVLPGYKSLVSPWRANKEQIGIMRTFGRNITLIHHPISSIPTSFQQDLRCN